MQPAVNKMISNSNLKSIRITPQIAIKTPMIYMMEKSVATKACFFSNNSKLRL